MAPGPTHDLALLKGSIRNAALAGLADVVTHAAVESVGAGLARHALRPRRPGCRQRAAARAARASRRSASAGPCPSWPRSRRACPASARRCSRTTASCRLDGFVCACAPRPEGSAWHLTALCRCSAPLIAYKTGGRGGARQIGNLCNGSPGMTSVAADHETRTCRLVRSGEAHEGKQGLLYSVGVSAESVGASGIHLQLVTIPPGGRAKAHKHAAHETAIYALSGESCMWYGEETQGARHRSPGRLPLYPGECAPPPLQSEPDRHRRRSDRAHGSK